jgi:hypothetical protein
MPRTCTVCAHADRPKIDRTLVVGQEALRTIADRFSVSKTALGRHKENHLPATLAVAREAEQAASADDLLSQVRDLQGGRSPSSTEPKALATSAPPSGRYARHAATSSC